MVTLVLLAVLLVLVLDLARQRRERRERQFVLELERLFQAQASFWDERLALAALEEQAAAGGLGLRSGRARCEASLLRVRRAQDGLRRRFPRECDRHLLFMGRVDPEMDAMIRAVQHDRLRSEDAVWAREHGARVARQLDELTWRHTDWLAIGIRGATGALLGGLLGFGVAMILLSRATAAADQMMLWMLSSALAGAVIMIVIGERLEAAAFSFGGQPRR